VVLLPRRFQLQELAAPVWLSEPDKPLRPRQRAWAFTGLCPARAWGLFFALVPSLLGNRFTMLDGLVSSFDGPRPVSTLAWATRIFFVFAFRSARQIFSSFSPSSSKGIPPSLSLFAHHSLNSFLVFACSMSLPSSDRRMRLIPSPVLIKKRRLDLLRKVSVVIKALSLFILRKVMDGISREAAGESPSNTCP
jgi:hypothetical protein